MPRKRKASTAADTAATLRYTWEEVSWMTGLSIDELLQLFGRKANRKVAYDSLPPAFNERLLDELAENEATVVSSYVQ